MRVTVTYENGTGGALRTEVGELLGQNGGNKRVVEFIDDSGNYVAIPLHRVTRIDEIR